MAYKVRKSSRITEDIELIGGNGEVQKVISIDICIDRIMSGYRTAQLNLMKLEQAMKKKDVPEAAERYGCAIMDLFNIIFGADTTKEILEFFEGKYIDMHLQLLPFIKTVVEPALMQAVAVKKADIANNYGFSRKQRRKLGFK